MFHRAPVQKRPQTTGASCTHGAPGGGGGGLAVVAEPGAAVVSSFPGGSGGALVDSRSAGGQSAAESRCAPGFALRSSAAGLDAFVVAVAAAAHALESPLSIESRS